MNNSWKVGNLSGIGIYIHWTFFLLPAFVAFSAIGSGAGAAAAVSGVVLICAVFGCIVLHEMGHALMARHYGIATHDITLLPIGGVARLDHIPEKPSQELAVALAGPAVNVVIAAVLWAVLTLLSGMKIGAMNELVPVVLAGGSLLVELMWINVALVAFNLLPAFPMDGGRVLRALLAMKMPRVRATRVAARVAQVFAVLFGILGLFGNPMLILIAAFVFLAARGEANFVEHTAAARLPADSRAIDAGSVLFESGLQQFEIVRDNQVIGTLSKADLLRLLCAGEGQRTLAEVLEHRNRGSLPAA